MSTKQVLLQVPAPLKRDKTIVTVTEESDVLPKHNHKISDEWTREFWKNTNRIDKMFRPWDIVLFSVPFFLFFFFFLTLCGNFGVTQTSGIKTARQTQQNVQSEHNCYTSNHTRHTTRSLKQWTLGSCPLSFHCLLAFIEGFFFLACVHV